MTTEQQQLEATIAALESQRATLGDVVLELATSPLHARLANLLRPAGVQRRQVTVLFADVVGSTAMAQSVDAEATLDVLSGALRRMAIIIEAHQGRVLRFTGDGVKAAFGMDEAREDDAERALRAGLAIVEAGREQAEAAARLQGIKVFAVRVGVHTGDVALGAGVEADNTAMGAAVNIAARMQQSAPPRALLISHDTWSRVRGLFDLDVQPPLNWAHVKLCGRPPPPRWLEALCRSWAGRLRGRNLSLPGPSIRPMRRTPSEMPSPGRTRARRAQGLLTGKVRAPCPNLNSPRHAHLLDHRRPQWRRQNHLCTALAAAGGAVPQLDQCRLIAAGLSPLARAQQQAAAGRGYLKLVNSQRADARRVELIYLALPDKAMSPQRVAERVAHGGHDIPAADIERRFARSLRDLLRDFSLRVDCCQCFLNSGAVMEPVFDQTGAARVVHDAAHYQHLIQESPS